jgi:hypothetical protein
MFVYVLHVQILYGIGKHRLARRLAQLGNLQDLFHTFFKGCQFDLPHMPRRAVVSRYIPRRAFGIVVELHA